MDVAASKSLHDLNKIVYRTSPGWQIFLYILSALMLLLTVAITIGTISQGTFGESIGSILFLGSISVLGVVSVAGPWLAISDHGVEVSLVFHHVYTPWENIRAIANATGFFYVYLTEPVRFTLWPIPISGKTSAISVSSYGRRRDMVIQQIIEQVDRHQD